VGASGVGRDEPATNDLEIEPLPHEARRGGQAPRRPGGGVLLPNVCDPHRLVH
jgi:hypothetical protein